MRTHGNIITFYSYKGGTGRSMALANVAWLLASNGNRVLAIDWDLEAPGLPQFFRPFIDHHLLASSPGLIDILADHADRSKFTDQTVPSIGQHDHEQAQSDVSKCVIPLKWNFPGDGGLDLLSAGKPGPAYVRQVTAFDWQEFYARFRGHSFIESLKGWARSRYDYVLIDSRTGINDASGICTVQLPDILVVCLTLNRQNIEGSAKVAESVNAQRLHRMDEPLKIFPVPMRIEIVSEASKRKSALRLVELRFTQFLDHLPASEIHKYWGSVQIPYFPFYSFEEILCVFGDHPDMELSMSKCIERLTRYLTDGEVMKMPEVEIHTRAGILNAFAEEAPEKQPDRSCFISYSSKDTVFAERLRGDLMNAGVRCWFAPHDLPIGAKIRPGIDKAIHENSSVILILSVNSISSAWVEKEVETAFEREAATDRAILLPVRLDSTIMQAKEGWAADIRRQRNIGDFTMWQDESSYKAALSRLLEALRG